MSQRSQLVSEQTIASKNYTDLQNEYYKSANLGINEQKLSDAENKTQFTEQQQTQKFANSMALKWGDAGILPTDDNATILAKLQKSPLYLATLGAKYKSGTIQPKLLVGYDQSGNETITAVDPSTNKIISTQSVGSNVNASAIPSTTTSQVPFSLTNPASWFGETTTKTTVKSGTSATPQTVIPPSQIPPGYYQASDGLLYPIQ